MYYGVRDEPTHLPSPHTQYSKYELSEHDQPLTNKNGIVY